MMLTGIFMGLILTLYVVQIQAVQPTFQTCSPGATDMDVKSFSVSPYPICINMPVCFRVKGSVQAELQKGSKLSIVGRFGGQIVYTDSSDMCSVISGTSCPIPKTTKELTICVFVKASAPINIQVKLRVEARNNDGHDIFCQTGQVMFQRC